MITTQELHHCGTKRTESKVLTKKQVLESHGLWKIVRGHVVTRTWGAEGNYINLGFWGEGEVVGKPLAPSEVYEILALDYVELEKISSDNWEEIATALTSHIKYSQELVQIVNMRPISERLLMFLQFLSVRFSTKTKYGKQLNIPLIHESIGNTINSTRVTITRGLQDLEESGRIRRDKKWIITLLD